MSNEFVTVNVQGLDQLQKNLEELGKKGTAAVRGAVRAGAVVVQKEMVTLAPKDTGILSEHIDIRTKKVSGQDLAVSAFIGPNSKEIIHPQTGGKTKGLPRTALFICRLLEFGGERQSKRPFLTQAFYTSQNAALDKIIEYLKEKLGL